MSLSSRYYWWYVSWCYMNEIYSIPMRDCKSYVRWDKNSFYQNRFHHLNSHKQITKINSMVIKISTKRVSKTSEAFYVFSNALASSMKNCYYTKLWSSVNLGREFYELAKHENSYLNSKKMAFQTFLVMIFFRFCWNNSKKQPHLLE